MSTEGEMRRVVVPLGPRSYEVLIGRGARAATTSLLPAHVSRVALVTQAGVPEHLRPVMADFDVSVHVLPDGEEHKTISAVEDLCRGFSRAGLTRADAVVSVGGGLTSDVAGFAAAVYHRGVAVVHVSTTLLGMVDAAIGGKTGVNLAEGKNLVGAFWQPSGVVCDTAALDSLSAREMRSGSGEMAKYHFLDSGDLSVLTIEERVARCVAIKAEIVAGDEREGGRRALLNYGHTLAHALETVTDYALTHGEAVGMGLVFAATLARSLGRIDDERVEEHRRIVEDVYGLDSRPSTACGVSELMDCMARDKKALGSLTFVLDSAHGLEVVRDLPVATVERVLREFLAA